MAHKWWVMYLAAVALGALVFLAVPEGTPQGVCYLIVGFSAVGALGTGVRRWRPAHGAPWLVLAAGVAVYRSGDVIWNYVDLVLGLEPFPSWADAAYLSGYGLIATSLVVFAHKRARGERTSLLDAAIVATGVGVLAWVLVITPYVQDPELTNAARLISLAYPVGDVALLALVARLALTPGNHPPASRLLGAGLVALLATDIGFTATTLAGASDVVPVVDAGFLVAFGLVGAAGLHPSMGRVSEAVSDRPVAVSVSRLVLMATASLLAPGILVAQSIRGTYLDGLVIGGASMVLFLLVLVRMSGLVHEVQRQAAALDALARVDGLTCATNRRGWDEALPQQLAIAERERGGQVAIALLDIDHFKRFNDSYGHQAGDRLLQAAVAAWQEQLRPGDVLARYGGEEFAVLLPRCRMQQALEIVDRLRAAVPEGQTCSAGVAVWDGAEKPDALVARTDLALYRAKAAGRDRAVPAGVPAAV